MVLKVAARRRAPTSLAPRRSNSAHLHRPWRAREDYYLITEVLTLWAELTWHRASDKRGPSWGVLFGCEHPFDASAFSVALAFPGGGLGDETGVAFDAPIEALGRQDADLDLHHVEPAVTVR